MAVWIDYIMTLIDLCEGTAVIADHCWQDTTCNAPLCTSSTAYMKPYNHRNAVKQLLAVDSS